MIAIYKLPCAVLLILSYFQLNDCHTVDVKVSPMPNIGFLGHGYDMLRSNPRPVTQPLDTGFVSPIFDMMKYEENMMTTDNSHRIPDSTYVTECTACQLNYKSSIISGAGSFKSSLNSLRTTTVGGWRNDKGIIKWGYRASESYMKTVEEAYSYGHVLIDTSATCLVYCAEMRLPLKPTNLDQAFVEAVNQLPSDFTIDGYEEIFHVFLRRFGTHVVTSMKAGSLFWQRATFTAANYSKLVAESQVSGVEMSAGFLFLKLSKNDQSIEESSLVQNFKGMAASITTHSLGAIPPSVQDPNNKTSWLEATRQYPMPMDLQLTPITALITRDFFPNVKNIDWKRQTLAQLVENGRYCSYLATVNAYSDVGDVNCGNEAPDSVTFGLQGRSNFGGTYYKPADTNVQDIKNQINGFKLQFRFNF